MLNSTGKRLPSQSRDLVPVSQILMTDVYVTMHGPQVGDQSTATTRWREIHGTLSPGQSPRQQRGAGIGITAHQCMPCSAGKQNSPTLILGQEVGHQQSSLTEQPQDTGRRVTSRLQGGPPCTQRDTTTILHPQRSRKRRLDMSKPSLRNQLIHWLQRINRQMDICLASQL